MLLVERSYLIFSFHFVPFITLAAYAPGRMSNASKLSLSSLLASGRYCLFLNLENWTTRDTWRICNCISSMRPPGVHNRMKIRRCRQEQDTTRGLPLSSPHHRASTLAASSPIRCMRRDCLGQQDRFCRFQPVFDI